MKTLPMEKVIFAIDFPIYIRIALSLYRKRLSG